MQGALKNLFLIFKRNKFLFYFIKIKIRFRINSSFKVYLATL